MVPMNRYSIRTEGPSGGKSIYQYIEGPGVGNERAYDDNYEYSFSTKLAVQLCEKAFEAGLQEGLKRGNRQ